jgi:AraC-like DNA-binding protein
MLGELVRYDGLRVLKFPIPGSNATTLRPNGIVQLSRDLLLLGGDFGLKIFDTRKLTFGDSILIDNNPVYTMNRIGNHAVLIGRAKGLMMMRNGSMSMDTITVPHAVNNLSAAIYDIDVAVDSTVWITTSYGIFKAGFSQTNQQLSLKYVTGGPSCFFSRIAVVGSKIYAYSSGMGQFKRGLHVYSLASDKWQHVNLNTQLPIITDMVVNDSLLYVSADNTGISVVNTHDDKIIGALNLDSNICRLRSNGVYSLFIDRVGKLYVGYYQTGVQVLSPKRAATFTFYGDGGSFTTEGMFVRTMARKYPYQITATRDKVIITDEYNHTTRTLNLSLFNNGQPTDIVPVGDIFAVGVFGGGLYYLNPQGAIIKHIAESDGLRVCDIDVDKQKRVWVAATEGVYRFDGEKLDKVFNSDNSCIKSGVLRIYFDRKGRGWVTTQSGGMAIYDPQTDKLRNDLFPNGFIDKEFVRCITEDVKGNLMFAYNRNKLFTSDPDLKKFSTVGHHMPIGNADINIMQQLPDGSWLIGASVGLYGTRDFNTYKTFGVRDGIVDNHINPSHLIDDERLYISTGNGLMVSDLKTLMPKRMSGSLLISEVHYNGECMKDAMPDVIDRKLILKVPMHTGSIDIFLSDLVSTLDSPDFIEYCMDGDTVWKYQEISRPISIYNSDSPNHNIKVRLAGAPESMLLIETREQCWYSVMWMVLAVLFTIAIATAFVIIRHHRKTSATVTTPIADGMSTNEDRDNAVSSKYRNIKIPDEDLERVSKRLDLLLYDTRIYLQPDLKIGQLADKLGVSTAFLSYYFSQHLGSNYYRFLNSYRIKEFKDMVAQGSHRTYTLSSMSQMCGFSSRTSFFRYFKEAEGISPLDYIKRAEKSETNSSK